MNVKEKIQIFNKIVMNEAEEKRKQIMIEVSKKLSDACKEAEEKAQSEADEIIKSEIQKAELTKNKDFVDASTEAKKSLIELRNNLTLDLQQLIRQRLTDFMKTEQYKKYIIDNISKYAKKYDEIEVTVMPCDIILSEKILNINKNISIKQSERDFIGGFIAISKSKHIILDETFETKLEEQINSFNIFNTSFKI